MMGGDITVVSEVGKGSTFTIHLPVRTAPVNRGELDFPLSLEPEGGQIVLSIDDDPAVREVLRAYLTREGFHVETAANGPDGLKLAAEIRPDVITLDVMMPGMDGWSVLSALKSTPELSEIPVIMLTIFENAGLGYALGASDYLTKPIDRHRLKAVLEKHAGAVRLGTILVVEDEDTTRRMTRQMLERGGWKVTEAANGIEGLARVQERRPDLIVLDLMMPEMDGFEFLEELRAIPECRSIPVIVATAKELTLEDHVRLTGSVERILQKGTTSRKELLEMVREFLVSRVRREMRQARERRTKAG